MVAARARVTCRRPPPGPQTEFERRAWRAVQPAYHSAYGADCVRTVRLTAAWAAAATHFAGGAAAGAATSGGPRPALDALAPPSRTPLAAAGLGRDLRRSKQEAEWAPNQREG